MSDSQPRRRDCPECGGSFAARALNRHRSDKHGVNRRTYNCPHCDKSFPRNDARMDHIRNCHGISRPETREQDEVNPRMIRRHTKQVLAEKIIEESDKILRIKQDCYKHGAGTKEFKHIDKIRSTPKMAALRRLTNDKLSGRLQRTVICRERWKQFRRAMG